MKRIFSPTGLTSRGFRESDMLLTLTSVPTTQVTSGSSTTAVVYDENVQSYTSAATVTEGRIDVEAPIGAGVSYANLTPEVATIDETTRQLTRVASGTSKVNVKVRGRIKQVTTPVSMTGSTTAAVFQSFATGSLAKHCYDWFLAAVAGKTASAATLDFLAPTGERSATIWANAVDLSCVITGNSNNWQQGALIAPRFAIVATHVIGAPAFSAIGFTYTCRDAAGTAVTRTVTGETDLGNDVFLLRFDSAFTGITPAKILPSAFGNKYKPGQLLRQGVPVMKWSRVGGFQVGIGVGNGYRGLSYARPSELAPWYMEYEGGDSGSPYGTVVNGQFVFLGNAWTGPGTNDDGGSFVASNISGLTAAMDALVPSSSSTLSYVDLSSFPTY